MGNPIFDHIESLMCTKCGSNEWIREEKRFVCKSCNNNYEVRDDKLITVNDNFDEQNWESVSDGFDLFKGNENFFTVDKINGPRIKDLRQQLNITGMALNLGSGQDNHDGFVNMDLGQYDPVDIVADLTKVPLIDNSVELIVSNSVLEHIYDYNCVINEAHRILSKGGYFYLCVPNANCIRHHKYDYHRWTSPGLRKLFENRFEIIESGASRGIPYSLIAYVEALLTYKIKNTVVLSISRLMWRLISRPLYWIKYENNEEYQALSHTIYILAKKL